jgi:HK97 family phage major capsid protein
MSCIQHARAINDTYPDPTVMPADKMAERKALLGEARRLQELADTQKAEDDLTAWATTPTDTPQSKALIAAAGGATGDAGDILAGATKAIQMKSFLLWMQGVDRTPEQKAALVENATGEILVPHEIMAPIFKDLPHLGTFRRSNPLIRPTTRLKVDVRSITGATAGWGKLETGGSLTDANVLPNSPADVVEVFDLLALSQVGVDELMDTDVDNLPGLIQQIVGLKFAEMEDDAFANGNGTSKPFGLAMRATQAVPLITQSVTSAAGGVKPDDLKKLPFAVPTVFRDNGAYYLADDAAMAVALLKDSTSNYLWQPSIRAGEPATLFGYRTYTLEGLPRVDSGNSTPSVIFGDPGLGYLVADRQQISMQRLDERYAELGLVGFLFKLRVGGDVIRPKAFAKYIVVD